jgi:hypothetical protein
MLSVSGRLRSDPFGERRVDNETPPFEIGITNPCPSTGRGTLAAGVADGNGVNIPQPAGARRRCKRVVPYRIGAAVATFQETAPAL